MAQKIPPPPFLTGGNQQPDWQAFNRWLLEVTSVLSNEGNINPDEVEGLPLLFSQVATNTVDISALEGTTGGQSFEITALQNQISGPGGINDQIGVINGQLTTLAARAQVFNGVTAPAAGLGNVNDWYARVGGAVGARIYIKTAIGTWTPFPF